MSHLSFDRNIEGRDFVIGDLHGCHDLLMEVMENIEFDKSIDRMFSVGDLVDRGDKSMECLRLIDEDWFHAVSGNHEELMVNSLIHGEDSDLWHTNGGLWHFDEDPNELRALVGRAAKLPTAMTITTISGRIGISHAQPPSLDWDDARNPTDRDIQIMRWARSWIENDAWGNVAGMHMTIHGHTIVESPVKVGNALFIDTGAVFSGKLVCMEL